MIHQRPEQELFLSARSASCADVMHLHRWLHAVVSMALAVLAPLRVPGFGTMVQAAE